MYLVVMLIWAAGQYNGSPAVIPGFASMEKCDQARSIIEKGYVDLSRRYEPVRTQCVELAVK